MKSRPKRKGGPGGRGGKDTDGDDELTNPPKISGPGWRSAVTHIPVTQRYHWYNGSAAKECLRDKRVWVIGDSYMRNLFIGLMDVLRGVTKGGDDVIKVSGAPEQKVKIDWMPKMFGDVGQRRFTEVNLTTTFIGGTRFSLDRYIDHLKVLLTKVKDADLVVLNVLIHDNKRNIVVGRFKGDKGAAAASYSTNVLELSRWMREQRPKGTFVWATSTSYKEKKVPAEFRPYQGNQRILGINRKAKKYWTEAGFPTLDVFHITHACQADSCSFDGSHHNRMVNRAKAHVLLNHLCRPAECDQPLNSKMSQHNYSKGPPMVNSKMIQ